MKSLYIGLVFDYNMSYPRGILRGIRQFAQTRPHWILVPIDTERLTVRALKTMQPDGTIALIVYAHIAQALKSLGRPVVNTAKVLPELPFPRVGVNQHQIGRMAAMHLGERGLHHFGFLGHPTFVYSMEREAGFRKEIQARGHALTSFHERPVRAFQRRGRLLALDGRLQQWLRDLPKPAGVFACNDIYAMQIVEACRLAELRVPDDIAVIGVDNDELRCELARPSLSSIILPAERIGYEAAALLERLIDGSRPPRRPRLLPPVGVVRRQSTDVLAGRDPDVTAAVAFIRDHAHRPLSVDDVLEAVPVSRRALERRFRAALECSIGEEIRRVHVERARELLASTALLMDEVAEQAGFSSVHYLCRVFRQEMGLTPTAYRRQVRNAVGLGAGGIS
jgi:LacI family transcriptional regulator